MQKTKNDSGSKRRFEPWMVQGESEGIRYHRSEGFKSTQDKWIPLAGASRRGAGEFSAHDASAASAGYMRITAVQAVQIVPIVQNVRADFGLIRELNVLNGA
jgi:hypothetical protein